ARPRVSASIGRRSAARSRATGSSGARVADPQAAERELVALAQLGLAPLLDTASAETDELPIDRLLRLGRIERHQALAARALVADEPAGSGAAVATPTLRAGARVGPLEVVRALGSGTSGSVYEVRHVE